ncbi:uncharacterized protein ISCGN_024294 [Ixodes scapularis]
MTTTALLFALCLLGLAAAQGGFDYDSPEENPDDNPVIDISSEETGTSFPETTPAGVGSQILRQHKALINKIQTMIQNGKDSERNLTSLRRVVARKIRRETNQNKRKQLQSRMKELTRLITNLRDREARNLKHTTTPWHEEPPRCFLYFGARPLPLYYTTSTTNTPAIVHTSPPASAPPRVEQVAATSSDESALDVYTDGATCRHGIATVVHCPYQPFINMLGR